MQNLVIFHTWEVGYPQRERKNKERKKEQWLPGISGLNKSNAQSHLWKENTSADVRSVCFWVRACLDPRVFHATLHSSSHSWSAVFSFSTQQLCDFHVVFCDAAIITQCVCLSPLPGHSRVQLIYCGFWTIKTSHFTEAVGFRWITDKCFQNRSNCEKRRVNWSNDCEHNFLQMQQINDFDSFNSVEF